MPCEGQQKPSSPLVNNNGTVGVGVGVRGVVVDERRLEETFMVVAVVKVHVPKGKRMCMVA